MIDKFILFFNGMFSYLYNWPPTDRYTVIGILLGALSLSMNFFTIRTAARKAKALQKDAVTQIENRIREGLSTPQLISANALRSLSYAIEKNTKCPVITDKMISESIRKVALEIENHYKGKALVRRLELLDATLKELDPKGLPLLSIADTDRILSFRLASLAIGVFLFELQIVVTLLPISQFFRGVLVCLLIPPALLLVIANKRAISLWSKAKDLKLKRSLDFNLILTNSRSLNVHRFWGVAWEEIGFHAIPLLGLPLVVGLFVQAGKVMNLEKSALMTITIVGCVFWLLLFYIMSIAVPVRLHIYKWMEKKRLAWQLNTTQGKILKKEALDGLISDELLTERTDICNKLWSITGDDYYRILSSYQLSGIPIIESKNEW